MASFNRITVLGNLGSDPEVKNLDSGKTVAKFSLAVADSYKDGETTWFKVELWEQLAKTAEKYLKKGNQVLIDGSLKMEKWTDKNGVERTAPVIRASTLTMLGGSKPEGQSTESTPAQSANSQTSRESTPFDDDSEDLPF